jgi:hypothetical protein
VNAFEIYLPGRVSMTLALRPSVDISDPECSSFMAFTS